MPKRLGTRIVKIDGCANSQYHLYLFSPLDEDCHATLLRGSCNRRRYRALTARSPRYYWEPMPLI